MDIANLEEKRKEELIEHLLSSLENNMATLEKVIEDKFIFIRSKGLKDGRILTISIIDDVGGTTYAKNR